MIGNGDIIILPIFILKKNKLEIHWRLNPGPGKEPNFSELWERKRISILTKNYLYFLGREDLFLFLVISWCSAWLVTSTLAIRYPSNS